ncbi:MAG: two-component regulator propeller domain-containing protein, partial [bacterium]
MIFRPKLKSENLFRLQAWISFILILIIPGNNILRAQDYFFDSYSVAEGIAQSTVFDIHQDHKDFVWLGTRAGVSRFDGNNFINYNREDGMAENGVRVIFRDKQNILWFGHVGGGISNYDGHTFSVFSSAGEYFDSNITAMLTDDEGNLWITSESSGAVKISEVSDSLSNSVFKVFIGDDLSDRIFDVYKTKNGKIHFVTDAFLKIAEPSTNSFDNFIKNGMPRYFLITCMYEDSDNNLWFGTHNGGLYKYIPEEDTSYVLDSRDGLASNWISCITEDGKGNLWVGTWGGGITVINNKDTLIIDNSNGLNDLYIRQIKEDHEGNIIVGTNENGISIFKGFSFSSFFPEHGLRDPQVWSIIQDGSGKYWFATSNGISQYRPDDKNSIEDYPRLKNMQISFLKEDLNSRVWIATESQGIFSHNRKNSNIRYHYELNDFLRINPNTDPSLKVTALETDKEGRLWIGTLGGLLIYNFEKQLIYFYTQGLLSIYNLSTGESEVIELEHNTGLANNEITTLYYAPDNKMWIGTIGEGLNYYARNSLNYLPLDLSFTATSMGSDNDGFLWVGTEANGVLKVDPRKKEIVSSLTESEGLLANLINLTAIDYKNNIYIGTNRGLNIFDVKESRIYTYNEKNGFPGIETKPGAVYIDRANKLWFGTLKGVTRLDPDLMYHSNLEPLTHITGFFVNNIE